MFKHPPCSLSLPHYVVVWSNSIISQTFIDVDVRVCSSSYFLLTLSQKCLPTTYSVFDQLCIELKGIDFYHAWNFTERKPASSLSWMSNLQRRTLSNFTSLVYKKKCTFSFLVFTWRITFQSVCTTSSSVSAHMRQCNLICSAVMLLVEPRSL